MGHNTAKSSGTMSVEDNLSIFTQRLDYQYVPDNAWLKAQDKLSCRWPLRSFMQKIAIVL
jgi:hypothetical protein